jgi:hypothetical protein
MIELKWLCLTSYKYYGLYEIYVGIKRAINYKTSC